MCGPKQAWAETNSAGKLMMQDTRIDTSKKKSTPSCLFCVLALLNGASWRVRPARLLRGCATSNQRRADDSHLAFLPSWQIN